MPFSVKAPFRVYIAIYENEGTYGLKGTFWGVGTYEGIGTYTPVVLVVDSHWLECILSYCPHNMYPHFGSNLL